MSEVPYEVWEEQEMVKEIEQLREENHKLRFDFATLKGNYKALQDIIEKQDKEIERLKQENENLKYKNNYISEVAIEEQNKLKEALRKCSPFTESGEWCGFCEADEDYKHTDDCEYVRLTGGAE